MPFGLSTGKYLRIVGAYVIVTFLGAEAVHQYFRPDLSIPKIPPKKGELKTELYFTGSRSSSSSSSSSSKGHTEAVEAAEAAAAAAAAAAAVAAAAPGADFVDVNEHLTNEPRDVSEIM